GEFPKLSHIPETTDPLKAKGNHGDRAGETTMPSLTGPDGKPMVPASAFGKTDTSTPRLGDNKSTIPDFGKVDPLAPTFGKTDPPTPAFGKTDPPTPAFGKTDPPAPAFGKTDPPTPPLDGFPPTPASSAPDRVFSRGTDDTPPPFTRSTEGARSTASPYD